MSNNKEKTYFVTGGGTGGHIYPAIAVVNELRNQGVKKIFYVGNPNNLEATLAKEHKIEFLPVNINGMPRKISFSSVTWAFKLIFAIIKSMKYIKTYKPDLIFGTGGYVSAPILFAAKFLKIPYALHDADAQPGIVTRCFASNSVLLTTPFEAIKQHLFAPCIEVTDNPIRKDFITLSKTEAREKLNLKSNLTLLVMGGSQGAKSVNEAFIPILKKLIDNYNICILHQTGKKRFDEVVSLLKEYFPDYENCENYRLFPYVDDMPTVLKSTDIAISRSGSLSLSEMKASGIASILIPYPYSAGQHQKRNAEAMVELGCSVMIEDKDLSSQKLYEVLSEIITDNQKLSYMQNKALENSNVNATEKIVERLLNI